MELRSASRRAWFGQSRDGVLFAHAEASDVVGKPAEFDVMSEGPSLPDHGRLHRRHHAMHRGLGGRGAVPRPRTRNGRRHGVDMSPAGRSGRDVGATEPASQIARKARRRSASRTTMATAGADRVAPVMSAREAPTIIELHRDPARWGRLAVVEPPAGRSGAVTAPTQAAPGLLSTPMSQSRTATNTRVAMAEADGRRPGNRSI